MLKLYIRFFLQFSTKAPFLLLYFFFLLLSHFQHWSGHQRHVLIQGGSIVLHSQRFKISFFFLIPETFPPDVEACATTHKKKEEEKENLEQLCCCCKWGNMDRKLEEIGIKFPCWFICRNLFAKYIFNSNFGVKILCGENSMFLHVKKEMFNLLIVH